MARTDVSLSKLMALALRHEPERFALDLDDAGWTALADLVRGLRAVDPTITEERVAAVVAGSDKRRFALVDGRIRANQGHSLTVDLKLAPAVPPPRLFHGTIARFVDAIRIEGLVRRRRHHVHLSADAATATTVGERRGVPVVLSVDAAAMVDVGHPFFRSENGVWLTDHVPPAFIQFP